jgi:hypothetical protein
MNQAIWDGMKAELQKVHEEFERASQRARISGAIASEDQAAASELWQRVQTLGDAVRMFEPKSAQDVNAFTQRVDERGHLVNAR